MGNVLQLGDWTINTVSGVFQCYLHAFTQFNKFISKYVYLCHLYIYIHKIHVFSIVFYVNLYACRSCVLPIGQFVKILCSNLIFSWFFQVHSNEQAGWWRHGVCFGGRFGPTPIWTIWNHWSLHPWDNPPGAVETAKFLCRL